MNGTTWLASFAIASVLGIAVAYQLWASPHGANRPSFWDHRVILPPLIPWLVWAAFAPVNMLILERADEREAQPWLSVALYAVLAVGAIVLHATVAGFALGWWWSFPNPVPLDPTWHIADLLRNRSVVSLLVFALITAVYHARARGLSQASEVSPAPEAVPRPDAHAPVALKTGDRVVFVQPHQIDWIEADRDYVIIHAGDARYRVRDTMAAMEYRLPPEQLIRISRSAIVNVSAITEMQPWFRGEFVIILRDGSRVPTGRKYRDRITRFI